MHRKRHRWLAGIVALAIVLLAAAMVFGPRTIEESEFVMGSMIRFTAWTRGGNYSFGHALYYVEELEEELNAARDAPAFAEAVMERSGGAFNPYLGALAALWNIDGKDGAPPRVPSQAEIDQALQERKHDPGAYGKGMACDVALRELKKGYGLSGVVIDLGGNIVTYGQKSFWQRFQIALRDPLGGPNDTMGVFALKGTRFLSTSGSYEKYFEQGGGRWHHIFDPETGYPAEREPGLASVTVVTTDAVENAGAVGDALSTACFVLGYDASQDLLETYKCAAIFVYAGGAVRASGDVRNYFTLDEDRYHWE